jgi:hypothetical protein
MPGEQSEWRMEMMMQAASTLVRVAHCGQCVRNWIRASRSRLCARMARAVLKTRTACALIDGTGVLGGEMK